MPTTKKRRQVVIPDGNCLFRSLAVSLVHVFTGKNCGRGKLLGHEKTLGQAIHNVVAHWLRVLIVYNLSGDDGENVTIGTAWGGKSLFKVLAKIHRLANRHRLSTRFTSPRAAREFIRRLKPQCPPLRVGKGHRKFPSGFTAAEVTQSGRLANETFSQYCHRLLRPGTWGGAAECYVAAQVLRLPVHVFQRNVPPQIYLPDNKDEVQHCVHVRFDGVEHYDAMLLDARGVPPIMEL
jgi:hypothetical protein